MVKVVKGSNANEFESNLNKAIKEGFVALVGTPFSSKEGIIQVVTKPSVTEVPKEEQKTPVMEKVEE